MRQRFQEIDGERCVSYAWGKNEGLPEFLRSQSRPFGQILELRPDNAGMNFLLGSGKRGEPSVAAGHDVFLQFSILHPPWL